MIKDKEQFLLKTLECLAVIFMVILLGIGASSTSAVYATAKPINSTEQDTGTTPSSKVSEQSDSSSAGQTSESESQLSPVTYAEITRTIKQIQEINARREAVAEVSAEPVTESNTAAIAEETKSSEYKIVTEDSAGISSDDTPLPLTEYIPEDVSADAYDILSDSYIDMRISEINGFIPQYINNYTLVKMSWEGLEDTLTTLLSSFSGDWSLYFKDIKNNKSISINDHSMESASLIKLYIMGTVYDAIENKSLEMTDTIQNLLNDMITVSDNESSNELVRALSPSGDHSEGMAKVNQFIEKNNFTQTKQVNGLADPSLWTSSGEVNTTSTSDCGKFLEDIYNGTLVSHLASRNMESLLLNQQITYKIPAGIPTGVHTANKTGEVNDTENDAAIIYSGAGDYILCIMSTNLTSTDPAVDHINSISSMIYEYLNN